MGSTIATVKGYGPDVVYVPVMAVEREGKNCIPAALAEWCAEKGDASVANDIIQANIVEHTGAGAMSRMLKRAVFKGAVVSGKEYVLVDDAITMGGTMAEQANYIQNQGGKVAGVMCLTNVSRGNTLTADSKTIASLRRKFKDEIEKELGIKPEALTGPEAKYLDKFKDVDSLRARIAEEKPERLPEQTEEVTGSVRFSKKEESAPVLGQSLFPEVQERIEAARGIRNAPIEQKITEGLKKVWMSITRHHPLLPSKRYGGAIDKTGETIYNPITSKVEKVEDLIGLLKEVRDGRIQPVRNDKASGRGEQGQDKSGMPEGPEGTKGGNVHIQPALSPAGGVGDRQQQGGAGSPATGRHPGRPGEPQTAANNEEPDNRPVGGKRRPDRLEGGQEGAGGTSDGGNIGSRRTPDENKPNVPISDTDALDIQKKAKGEKQLEDISSSVFENYKVKKIDLPGAKPHPADIVESAAMAAVDPPDVTYSPQLSKEVVTSGKLSEIQIEPVCYAGQAHSELLPNGTRRGYFIGDGTGVGKGREIAAIIWDNWNQGRKKAWKRA
ncbi:MAG: strawberry notch family protein [Chloroflexota bacterium]|nr:strawberry notch family protein [Chloroflexota bacterium]